MNFYIDCVANNINNAIKGNTKYGRIRWEKTLPFDFKENLCYNK